jgi:hypothetical protein
MLVAARSGSRARGGHLRPLRRPGLLHEDLPRSRTEDVRYYVELAPSAAGPCSNTAAGNGRITIPMARNGLDVTARGSLRRDARRPARCACGRAHRGRVARHRPPRRHAQSCASNERFLAGALPLQRLPSPLQRTDVEAFLARVRAHLAPRGELVFDVSMPEPEELARDPDAPPPHALSLSARRAGRARWCATPSASTTTSSGRCSSWRWSFEPIRRGESWMTPARPPAVLPAGAGGAAALQRLSRSPSSYGDFDRSTALTEGRADAAAALQGSQARRSFVARSIAGPRSTEIDLDQPDEEGYTPM